MPAAGRRAPSGYVMIQPSTVSGWRMFWGLALVSLVAFLLAFASHSPGWMGLGLLLGFVSGIAAALVFIDRHVRASGRPEHMTPREVEALRTTVRKPGDPPRALPPTGPSPKN